VSAEPRANPAVQQAYFFVVALIAIHMVVLGVANLLRVGAEIALGAQSGGFTGLPFVFAEFNRPRELYREQASLAIALLAVGGPAWFLHWRAAQRSVARDPAQRGSALRSLYLHLVVLITALLVFGYGQRALRLAMHATFAGDLTFFRLESFWEARAAGALSMALAAAVTLAYHLRVSMADRAATVVRGHAAELRHLALYLLVVIGLFFAAFTTAGVIAGLWSRVIAPALGAPPTAQPFSGPTRDELLRFDLVQSVPSIITGAALWLGAWLPLQRGVRAPGADGDVERRSVLRKLAVYLVVAVSAVTMLGAATIGIAAIGRRVLGDPVAGQFTSLQTELGGPIGFGIVFALVWLFHRRVVEGEATREVELERQAAVRRIYYYLVAAIGLAMAAIGTAGVVGVTGSVVLGQNTHGNGETATYIALCIVGFPAWAFHWLAMQRRLDDAERGALQRRVYLYLAVLGGIITVLVAGSAALFRLLNALLAFSFTTTTWHDLWHLVVDASAGLVAFLWHVRIVRSDRAAIRVAEAEPEAMTYPFLVRIAGADLDSARERLAAALPSDASVTAVRVTPDGPGAVWIDALVPIENERGPASIIGIAAAVLAAFLLVGILASLFLPSFFASAPPAEPRPTTMLAPPPPRGTLLRAERGPILEAGREAELESPIAAPVLVEVEVALDDAITTLDWTVGEFEAGRLVVRLDSDARIARLLLVNTERKQESRLSSDVPVAIRGRAVRLSALVERNRLAVWADEMFVSDFFGKADWSAIHVQFEAKGAGSVRVQEMRVWRPR